MSALCHHCRGQKEVPCAALFDGVPEQVPCPICNGIGIEPRKVAAVKGGATWAKYFHPMLVKFLEPYKHAEAKTISKALREGYPFSKAERGSAPNAFGYYPYRIWRKTAMLVLGHRNDLDENAYPLIDEIKSPGGYGMKAEATRE